MTEALCFAAVFSNGVYMPRLGCGVCSVKVLVKLSLYKIEI